MKKNEGIASTKVERYYIFYSTGIKYYSSLEELESSAGELVKSIDGYIGIGLEYIKENNVGEIEPGAVDIINRHMDQSKFKWSNDYKKLNVDISKEHEELFEVLIERL